MVDRRFRETLAQLQAELGPTEELKKQNPLESTLGFAGSVAYGPLSLLGFDKPAVVSTYQRQNPALGFIAELAGTGVGFGAAFKGVSAIPKVGAFIDTIGAAGTSPIRTAFLREAAKASVVEGFRFPISQVVSDRSLFEDIGISGLNVVGGSVISGGLAALKLGGTAVRSTSKHFEGVNFDRPDQMQYRQVNDLIGTVDPEREAVLRNYQSRIGERIRAAESSRYVKELEGGGDARSVNRLFNVRTPASDFTRKKILQSVEDPSTFKSSQEVKNIISENFPEGWEAYTQYPRHINTKSESAARIAAKTFEKNFSKVDEGMWITREGPDGLFIVGKKVTGTEGKAAAGDSYVVFKTDNPGHFNQLAKQFSTQASDGAKFIGGEIKPKGPVAPIYDEALALRDQVLNRADFNSPEIYKGSPADRAAKINKALGIDKIVKGHGESVRRLGNVVNETLVPSAFQFTKSVRATKIMGLAQQVKNLSDGLFKSLVYGDEVIPQGKSINAFIMSKAKEFAGAKSIRSIIETWDEADLQAFHKLYIEEFDNAQLDELFKAGEITPNVYEGVKALREIDDKLFSYVNAVEHQTGRRVTQKREGHNLLSHRYDGDIRIALHDESGKVVAIAAGHNRKGAEQQLEKLTKYFELKGVKTRRGVEANLAANENIPAELSASVGRPGFTQQRQNVLGYKYWDRVPTKQELLKEYAENVEARTRYIQDMTINDLAADDLAKLSYENPDLARQVQGRINDTIGKQSPSAQYQNAQVDKLLGHVLGKNSASKIVAVSNTTMHNLELGAGNLAYPLTNLMSFVQTVIPEIAFVQGADKNALAPYYTHFLVGGERVGSVGALDPLKIWRESMRQMKKPDAELIASLNKAVHEDVLVPRMIEDYVGEASARVSDWRSALKSPDGFVDWVRGVSEFLPATSEKWARTNAFVTGHVFAKKILGVNEDAAYEFAKQFTRRTMFGYATADRARLFTSPAGSMFGLFKNWMFHYIGNTLNYTDEALARNNWAPLLWQTTGTFAVGGAAALPLISVADAFSKSFNDKSLLVNVYEGTGGGTVAEGLMYGLPAALSGGSVNISGSVQSPFGNPIRDANMLFGFAQINRLQHIGSAAGAAFDRWFTTGEHPGSDPNVRDLMAKAFAPKSIWRAMAAAEDDGIRSLQTGYPVLQEVGLGDRIAYAAGFNPTEIQNAYAVSQELYKNKQRMKEETARYGEALAQAYSRNNIGEVKEVLRNALLMGVDFSAIQQSAGKRLEMMGQDITERGFKEEDIEKRIAVIGE